MEDKEAAGRDARLLRGRWTKEATKIKSQLERLGADARTEVESERLKILQGWYNEYYEGKPSDDPLKNQPGLIYELRAAAAGDPNADVTAANEILEATAKTALESAGVLPMK